MLREEAAAFKANDAGYRDALCRRIRIVVRNAEVHEGQELAVYFDDRSSIHLSLRPEDLIGGEHATFWSRSGGLWVW